MLFSLGFCSILKVFFGGGVFCTLLMLTSCLVCIAGMYEDVSAMIDVWRLEEKYYDVHVEKLITDACREHGVLYFKGSLQVLGPLFQISGGSFKLTVYKKGPFL